MSISSKIFESVSFKNSNELKEGQKSEEFISQLKSDFSSIADGNTIAGYPTPDGAILNFTIDHKDDSKIAENIDKVVAELYPDYIANTNIDANDILDNVMVELSRKEDKPEGEDDFNEAGANVDIKAGLDIPDDLASSLGTAALMAASEEKECGKNKDKEKLEEIGPLAAGLLGAAAGGIATKMLSKEEDNPEEVNETTEIVVDDNGDVTVATDEENVTVAEELPCEDGDIACDGEEEIADRPADEVAPETVEPDESSVTEDDKCKDDKDCKYKKELKDVDKEISDFLEAAYAEEDLTTDEEKAVIDNAQEHPEDSGIVGAEPESENLEEIDPLATAALGAIAGNIATSAMSKKDESDEVKEGIATAIADDVNGAFEKTAKTANVPRQEFVKSLKNDKEVKESEEPASQVDFAHTQFEQVTNTIRTISELKAQDTENSLYTDLLRAYDDVQKILKDYINEQPVTTTETPAEAPAKETPAELPAEDIVDIENTEIEGE